jgi:uncharacterized phage protein (TIGR02216 family)
MTNEFAASATRLAGLAGAILGWRPEEFWRATPAELGVVIAALSPEGEAAMDGQALIQLMKDFPDARPHSGQGDRNG